MEALLDAADALVATGDEPNRPNFDIPEQLVVDSDEMIEQRISSCTRTGCSGNNNNGGYGWFSKRDLPAGTLLMACKPVAMVMDWQDDTVEVDSPEDADEGMDDAEEKEPRLNELLLLQILELLKHNPRLWSDALAKLFPRTNQDLASLPAWVCADDDVFFAVEAHVEQLRQIMHNNDDDERQLQLPPTVVNEIAKRLPLIIRYNVLSIETCSELLSYPGPRGHASLSGVGLYLEPSFFNHSSRPNCNRYAIGDVMFVVLNQPVAANQELFISYIEHDVLCESAYRRNQLLNMDFQDMLPGESIEPTPAEVDGPDMPVVDKEVQNELMAMDPFERLSAIEELMQQATGEKLPEEEEEAASENAGDEHAMDAGGSTIWFQCDVDNLRILKAITLDGMGQSKEAIQLWQEAIHFAETSLPPADESLVVLHVQAALCAHHMADFSRAKKHANAALETHNLLFGGGVQRFRRRYRNEFRLSIRPSIGGGKDSPEAHANVLWPMPVD